MCDLTAPQFQDPDDASEIKGDLGIELDADSVPAGDFLRAAESFVTILREVTRALNSKVPKDAWQISVQEGSQVMSVSATDGKLSSAVAAEVLSSIVNGISELEDSARVPKNFTDRALESAKQLSRIVMDKNKGRSIGIRLLSKERNIAKPITQNTFNHISEILDWKYEDLGTVSGTLELISSHGGCEFRVYEDLWLKPVRCFVDSNLLKSALSSFNQRVEVTGMIRYTRDGKPVSARVLKIDEFPDPGDLPSNREMRGILGRYDAS